MLTSPNQSLNGEILENVALRISSNDIKNTWGRTNKQTDTITNMLIILPQF